MDSQNLSTKLNRIKDSTDRIRVKMNIESDVIEDVAAAVEAIEEPKLASVEFTKTGTFKASDEGLDGFSEVVVNTPAPPETGYIVEEYDANGYPSKIRLDNVTSLSKGFIPSSSSFFMQGKPHITINSDTLKELPYQAFYQAGACTVVLPDTIEEYGDGSNFHNSQIDVEKLPENSFYIPSNMFAYDSALKSLKKLPPYINYIGNTAFQSTSITKLEIPDFCYQIEAWVFQDCTKLKELIIPPGVVSFSSSNQLFKGCTSMTKITFLGDYSNMGGEFATGCTSLREIWLPNVTSVPAASSANKLLNTPIASGNGSIYVPSGLVDAFKTSSYWSAYASTFKPIPLTSIKLKANAKMNIQATDKLKVHVLYNGSYAPVSDEYAGYTFDITGPATMEEDNFLTLTSEAKAGDKITIKVTSTYNPEFTDEITIDVINTNKWYTINFNNGQWKEAPTLTWEGHKQYMSDVGSFDVTDNTGTSTCTITVKGYTSFTMGLRSCCWTSSASCDASKANATSVSDGYGFITTRYKSHGYKFCTGTYSLNGGTNTILVKYHPGSYYHRCDPNRSFMWIDPSLNYIETYE